MIEERRAGVGGHPRLRYRGSEPRPAVVRGSRHRVAPARPASGEGSATRASALSLYDQLKNWVLASVEDQLTLSGRVMESIGLDTYEREFDCYVRLPGQPEDDYTLSGEIRFWVNVLDEMAAQGEEEPLEEQPLVLETTITISQERLGPSAVSMWDRVSAELSAAHADRAHLSLVQRYDAGSFDPAEAEAQIVAEWVRDPDSINETYVHEVISTFAEILRMLDEEFPLPEGQGDSE